MTKEYMIRRQHDGSQLQQGAPLDSKELSSNRRGYDYDNVSLPAVEMNSSFAHSNRRQRTMTWNRTRWLFWRLAVALSMIAVAAGHSETAPVDLDMEEEFFYAVESSDQTFDYSSHPAKDRDLQFGLVTASPVPPVVIPPFSFPPIPPIVIQFGKPSRPWKFDNAYQ
jgi:hypothetical protein